MSRRQAGIPSRNTWQASTPPARWSNGMLNRPIVPRPVVSREEWLTASRALLAKEKEAVRLRDRLNAERLALPWEKVEKAYAFDTPHGRKTLAELFDGRSQLIVYHFMLGPGWTA